MDVIAKLVLDEAKCRAESDAYQNLAAAIHSVLMKLGQMMDGHMLAGRE